MLHGNAGNLITKKYLNKTVHLDYICVGARFISLLLGYRKVSGIFVFLPPQSRRACVFWGTLKDCRGMFVLRVYECGCEMALIHWKMKHILFVSLL